MGLSDQTRVLEAFLFRSPKAARPRRFRRRYCVARERTGPRGRSVN